MLVCSQVAEACPEWVLGRSVSSVAGYVTVTGVFLNQLESGKYRSLVVDPPWNQRKTGRRRVRPNQGAALDYPTLMKAELLLLPISQWAHPDRSFIWLWATNSKDRHTGQPILAAAFELMEHWGYTYYTMVTWNKRTGPCPCSAPTRSSLSMSSSATGARRFSTPAAWASSRPVLRKGPARIAQSPRFFTTASPVTFPAPAWMFSPARRVPVLTAGVTSMVSDSRIRVSSGGGWPLCVMCVMRPCAYPRSRNQSCPVDPVERPILLEYWQLGQIPSLSRDAR